MDRTQAKNIKEIAKAILKNKDINYDEWLYGKHLEVLALDSDTIKSALNKSINN